MKHTLCLLSLLSLLIANLVRVDSQCQQNTVDYLASSLRLRYKVVDNWKDTPPVHLRAEFNLTNLGDEAIHDTSWEMYFSHARLLQLLRFRERAQLGDTGLWVQHVNGYLHKVYPGLSFGGFQPGETIQVEFIAEAGEVARSDVFPNWYITGPGCQPRTITSTSGESLDFVSSFLTEEQYKRTAQDLYHPFSAEERYLINEQTVDLGYNPKKVLPTPVEETYNETERVDIFSGDWLVAIMSTSLLQEADFLADRLGGAQVVNKTDAPHSHVIFLDVLSLAENDVIANEESYVLDVMTSPDFITIGGCEAVGVFWGIQTLLSLATDERGVPGGHVVDYPRFPYRGMHIDVARNFRFKLDIFKLLEAMSMFKMNKFHFHLTDDEGWRLEIPGIPELIEIGGQRCHDLEETVCIISQLGSGPGTANSGSGFYTTDDYQDILQFAKQRHIEVIPELDMPGHAHAAIKSMEARYQKYKDTNMTAAEEYLLSEEDDYSRYISMQFFRDGAINPCLDSTYTFVSHVIRELTKLHQDIQPLRVFNFGGDEVPRGAWTNSTACQNLMGSDSSLNSTSDLEEYFVSNVAEIAASHGLHLAGWEDGLMHGRNTPYDRDSLPNEEVYAYAWNNIWQLGLGEKAYLLANAGYKTVLSHATHFYFDHPLEPDPEERGYYWAARYADVRKVFSYMPDDVYANIDVGYFGDELDRDDVCQRFSCTPLDEDSSSKIIGLQGQLWSEVVRTSSQAEGQIFPKLVALAERAWHKASWEADGDPEQKDGELWRKCQEKEKVEDWARFANSLGYKELARLDRFGVDYHIPPPGARLTEGNVLEANCAYPGLVIRYSLDGGDTWSDYTPGLTMPAGSTVSLATRSADSRRASRLVQLKVGQAEITEPPDVGRSSRFWPPVQMICVTFTSLFAFEHLLL